MPWLSTFFRTVFRLAVHSLRQVFDVCEKSFSSSTLSSEFTSTHASQTRFALFLRSVDFVTFSKTIPPRRLFSPQPNSGS